MAKQITTTNRAAYPWRDVVETRDVKFKHSSGYTRFLKLSCGHELTAKASAGYPTRKRCTLCPLETK